MTAISWPGSKTFAFTIFDDTDLAVPGNFERVYDVLGNAGLRTTKSVWPATGLGQLPRSPAGSTCDDPQYLAEVLRIQRGGFEIGLHNTSDTGVHRAAIVQALDRFKDLFGSDPACMSNHQSCPEAIYWGRDRFTLPVRALYRAARRQWGPNPLQGHRLDSPFFWGDLCASRVRYVRSFVFDTINTLAAFDSVPYVDPKRPYVRAWFTSTFASWAPHFIECLREQRQDELEASGGLCILYTHFGAGFADRNGHPSQRFKEIIKRLGAKNGWFAPVSEILSYLEQQRGLHILTAPQRFALDLSFVARKLRKRATE